MVKECGQLPVIGTLPPCARPDNVKEYKANIHPGPSPTSIIYNWQGGLKTCPWNIGTTLLLANKYLEELTAGKIKYKGKRVVHEAGEITIAKLTRLIPKRLDRTQRHWKDVLEGGFTEWNNSPSPRQRQQAVQECRKMRRRNRARTVSPVSLCTYPLLIATSFLVRD